MRKTVATLGFILVFVVIVAIALSGCGVRVIQRLVRHIKRWNKWRKYCGNGWLHKISVLFGGHSPTFMFVLTDEEEDEMRKQVQEKFEEVCKLIRGSND